MEYGGKERERQSLCLFLVFPCISLLLSRALKYGKHIILLQTETCIKAQDKKELQTRNEILSLAETCHKAFGEQSRHTDWLHNGNVCRLLNISKRTLQHYRDTGVLPFAQIGHKCYYKREDVEWLLQTKSEKSKTDK